LISRKYIAWLIPVSRKQDAYFVQLNRGNGPSVVILADVPFLSKGVQLLNDLILSSKRELERLHALY
jgi:hypothetical protein